MAKILCCELIHIFVKCTFAARRVHNLEQLLSANGLRTADLFSLTNFISAEELIDTIRRSAVALSAQISAARNDRTMRRLSEIRACVASRFADASFSIKSLADELHMTPSSVSRLWRMHRHETLSEHIAELRLEKAKELLSRSEVPLQEIVKELGYWDATSFSKKFKRLVGLSPSDYRKMNRQAVPSNTGTGS